MLTILMTLTFISILLLIVKWILFYSINKHYNITRLFTRCLHTSIIIIKDWDAKYSNYKWFIFLKQHYSVISNYTWKKKLWFYSYKLIK